MQTFKLELDEHGVVYARIYVDDVRTSALTYEIPEELRAEAEVLQDEDDRRLF